MFHSTPRVKSGEIRPPALRRKELAWNGSLHVLSVSNRYRSSPRERPTIAQNPLPLSLELSSRSTGRRPRRWAARAPPTGRNRARVSSARSVARIDDLLVQLALVGPRAEVQRPGQPGRA